jgi:putative exosortase-associated protein (TIGR04073 family)
MKKTILLSFVLSLIAAASSLADSPAMDKLHRGLVNVLTAPVEIPKQVRASWIDGSEKTMHISAWLFYGFVKGLWMTPARMVSGFWDIVTFPLNTSKHEGGLLQPQSVFDDWPKRKKGVVYKNLGDR